MLPPPRYSRVVRPIFWSVPTLPGDTWRYRWESLHRLKDLIESANCRCLVWTINSDFSRPDRARYGQAYYRSWGLAAADYLNAKSMRFILGGPNTADLSSTLIKRTGKRIAEFVKEALQRYPQLELLIENHWGVSTNAHHFQNIFETACDLLTVQERDKLGICLDPLNLPPETDYQQAWQQLIPYAKHIHLKQKSSNGETIDLPRFISLVQASGYDRYWIIEDRSLLNL